MEMVFPVVISVCVGVVLVVAGTSKLSAGAAWTRDARELGAPRWSVHIVPWFEIVLGALLVVQVARRPLAVVAAVLFVGFTALLLRVMREGRRPTCSCFGALSARPLGSRHVIRNLALVVASLLAAW